MTRTIVKRPTICSANAIAMTFCEETGKYHCPKNLLFPGLCPICKSGFQYKNFASFHKHARRRHIISVTVQRTPEEQKVLKNNQLPIITMVLES